ncbi:MAG: hypothetical protein Q9195_005344 [Heterodermia aff. obscurata]
MNATIVDESTWEGIHTVIVHLSFPHPKAIVASQTSIDDTHDMEPQELQEPQESLDSHPEKPVVNGSATNGNVRKPLYTPDDQPYASRFEVASHPRADEVCAELDAFFATYWPWPNEKARQKFLATDTNRWGCWSLPLVKDDRIVDSVKVNTLLFLLDDIAENMSLEEGKVFYQRLILLALGKAVPNREDAYEWITYDTFASMRAVDEEQTNAIVQDAILCITAQVDPARKQCVGMGQLLRQRYKEGGVRFVASVIRYGMDLRISDASMEKIKQMEVIYSSFGMIVNDIYSYHKELRAYKEGGMEGGELLNAVEMQAHETGTSYPAAKRVLWVVCRELELLYLDKAQALTREMDVEGLEGKGEKNGDMRSYLKALEYVMSGNEKWSEYTERYHETD